MSLDKQKMASMFRIDVSPTSTGQPHESQQRSDNEMLELLRQLVVSQNRQTELLENMVDHLSAAQRQRAIELGQWKEANPTLARRCRSAAEAISQVQTEFLQNMTREINESYESMMDGDFVLNEFIDRYGPRLAHLNGVLQLLSQLSSVNNNTTSQT
jgi:hypothetical protein